MTNTKTCARCGGDVDVAVSRHQRPDGTYVSYAEGVCRSCGARYDEAALLTLKGPGPVGG